MGKGNGRVRDVRGADAGAGALAGAGIHVGVRALSAAALALACAFAALAPASLAWADEGAADGGAPDNKVNPQQLPDSSFIYDSSIADLGGADSYYDSQTVQVVGEAVGEAIRAAAGDGARWITLADPEYPNATISVLVSSDVASRIEHFGRYGETGATLQVRGTFHLTCREHEGLSDLHAQSVTVVDRGSSHPDSFDPMRFAPGAALVVAGLALVALFYHLRERQR